MRRERSSKCTRTRSSSLLFPVLFLLRSGDGVVDSLAFDITGNGKVDLIVSDSHIQKVNESGHREYQYIPHVISEMHAYIVYRFFSEYRDVDLQSQ